MEINRFPINSGWELVHFTVLESLDSFIGSFKESLDLFDDLEVFRSKNFGEFSDCSADWLDESSSSSLDSKICSTGLTIRHI